MQMTNESILETQKKTPNATSGIASKGTSIYKKTDKKGFKRRHMAIKEVSDDDQSQSSSKMTAEPRPRKHKKKVVRQ